MWDILFTFGWRVCRGMWMSPWVPIGQSVRSVTKYGQSFVLGNSEQAELENSYWGALSLLYSSLDLLLTTLKGANS